MSALITRQQLPSDVESVINDVLDGKTLREALKTIELTPQQFNLRLQSDKTAAAAYARALELKADLLADEVVACADSNEDPAKVRNQMTARQWIASKLYAKRYGDRIDLNVTQTIDVGSTLAEARARALSARYQQSAEDAQIIDLPSVNGPDTRDDESRNPVAMGNPQPDIFS